MKIFKILLIILILSIINLKISKAGPATTVISKIFSVSNPTKEVESAILFLQDETKCLPQDRNYIKFFSTYGVKSELRQNCLLTLSFTLHSLTGISNSEENAGAYYPIILKDKTNKFIELNKVTDTLCWIDIRNYNWTPEAWELIAQEDGYFVEPIVEHKTNGLLRLLSGNAVVRADWFIVHSTDVNKQSDRGRKTKIYETLLYAKNKIPKTIEEFEKSWGISILESRKFGNEFGTLVTKSQTIARHNRILFGYRAQLGWLYKTYDVKFQEGNRDYVETFPKMRGLPPTIFDAGEAFASNQHLLQVYTLYNGNGSIIDFGDPSVVRHITDIVGDVRVRVPHSCFDCHSGGPLPSENTIKEYIKLNALLKVPEKSDKLRIERNYLNDKFEESVQDNQILYARGLLKVNGLKPDENAKNYLEIINWYNQPLDIDQASFECGFADSTIFTQKLLENKDNIPGRLAILLASKESIPREIWESRGVDGIPGTFQQCMTLLYGLTKITYENRVSIKTNGTKIYSGSNVLKTCAQNDTFVVLGEKENGGILWYQVKVDEKLGYISSKDAIKIGE